MAAVDFDAIMVDVDGELGVPILLADLSLTGPTDFPAIMLEEDGESGVPILLSQLVPRARLNFDSIMLLSAIPEETTVTVTVEAPKHYFQRALDSGTGGYVYWTSVGTPDPTPTPSETTPNFTGTLSVYTIVRILGCDN